MKDPNDPLPLSAAGFARGLAVPLFLAFFACGGEQAGTNGPQNPSAPPPAAASASSSPSSAGSAGTATTTTQGLADGGEAQGTKLPDAPSSGSPASTAEAKPRGPHDHDPGRGLKDIEAIVKAHRDEARACYDKAVADHPGIEGDLYISWTIDPKGAVTKTNADVSRSTISEPGVISCVSDVIRKIQFAPSPGGFETKAGYPFNFHPHRAKPAQ